MTELALYSPPLNLGCVADPDQKRSFPDGDDHLLPETRNYSPRALCDILPRARHPARSLEPACGPQREMR